MPCGRAHVRTLVLAESRPAKWTASCSPSLHTQKSRQRLSPWLALPPSFLSWATHPPPPKPASWALASPATGAQSDGQGALAELLAPQPPVDVPAPRMPVLSQETSLSSSTTPATGGAAGAWRGLGLCCAGNRFTYGLLVEKLTL